MKSRADDRFVSSVLLRPPVSAGARRDRRQKATVCPTLLLFAAALFAQQKEPERASIDGAILNAATGEAIRKAQVTMHILPPTLGAPVSFTTDTNGKFTFTKLAPGNYVMMVRHPLFEMVKVGIRPDGNMGELIVLAAFRLRGIPPGRYKLWAWDEVNRLAVQYDPDFLTPFQSDAVEIEVHASEKKPHDLKLTVNK